MSWRYWQRDLEHTKESWVSSGRSGLFSAKHFSCCAEYSGRVVVNRSAERLTFFSVGRRDRRERQYLRREVRAQASQQAKQNYEGRTSRWKICHYFCHVSKNALTWGPPGRRLLSHDSIRKAAKSIEPSKIRLPRYMSKKADLSGEVESKRVSMRTCHLARGLGRRWPVRFDRGRSRRLALESNRR
jgi:hypothetical protein